MESVKRASDLVTSTTDTIDGFSWQAEEKLSRSKVFTDNAYYFQKNIGIIKSVSDIRNDSKLLNFAIAACMLSQKSLNHLDVNTQDKLISTLIEFDKLDNPEYIRQLQNRYFLTCGDSLGGTMRNVVGQYAQDFLSGTLLQRLYGKGYKPKEIRNSSNKIVSIAWDKKRVIFDKKPKFINKSVDIIVIGGNSAITGNLEDPNDYLCCGELKGGIDPAGADEHWKTAKTALERIHSAFELKKVKKPKLVFIGAAIETAMSNEIFELLTNGWLSGAANINKPSQLEEVVDLIIG